MMIAAQVIFANGRELHMVGEYTAVCWNTKSEPVTRVIDGITFHGYARVRNSQKPYIDFVMVQNIDDAEPYLDDDSPTDGGMDIAMAEQLRKELGDAIEYMKVVE